MHSLRQLGVSILFAAISLMLILGGLSTSLAESQINQPKVTLTETSVPKRETTPSPTPTLATPGLLPSATIVSSPSPTLTALPPTSCPPPAGWVAYTVRIGDTLESLASYHKVSKEQLKSTNCLLADDLLPNTRIYIPPPPTLTYIPCGVPAGWTIYIVKAGDNLYRISLAYRVQVSQLQTANCLGYTTNIKAGQKLYVPNVATSTPSFKTQTPTITATPTIATLFTATSTGTAMTSMPTATYTPAPPSETFTVVPSATDTPTPTATEPEP